MSNNFSDHTKPQINIEDFLPEVYRSEVNNTLMQQAFDRMFTADDTLKVSGFIGTGNPSVPTSNQIPEVSNNTHEQAHRQAFQLAPTMYTKVGTVETALSFRNFLTQLNLQGVDVDRLPVWGDALVFNWVPPINLDMLVNYQDYFWVGSSQGDQPQYFTIENQCSKATDRLTAYSSAILQRGMHFPILSVDFAANAFKLGGDFTYIFTSNFIFNTTISNTVNLTDKSWTVAVDSTYDAVLDITTILVFQPISESGPTVPLTPPSSGIIGEWFFDTTNNILYEWDSVQWVISTATISAQIALSGLFPIVMTSFANNTISVSGKQDDIFIPGFVFATRDAPDILVGVPNTNINSKFWTTASSVYDANTYTTTITLVEPLAIHSESPPITSTIGEWYYKPSTDILYVWNGVAWVIQSQIIIANISLEELVSVFNIQLNCLCAGSRGWDIGLWDDNSVGNVVWNSALLAAISSPTPPVGPAFLDLWYDTVNDQLKQYGDLLHPLPSDMLFSPTWNVVISNFSALLVLTTAQENWDQTVGCEPKVLNQWSASNVWKHKTAIDSFASAKRAQVPILEFNSDLELNMWTHVQRTWKYRETLNNQFALSNVEPSRFELEPIKGYQSETISGEHYIYLFDKTATMNADINLTGTFVPGYKFRIVDDIGLSKIYTVSSSEYRSMEPPTQTNPNLVGNFYATVVKLVESSFTAPVTGGGVNNTRIVPIVTSLGDMWLGYHIHWVLDANIRITTPNQPHSLNPFSDTTIASDAVAGNIAYAGFVPQVSIITYGVNYQELTIDLPNIQQIDVIPSLRYSPVLSTSYATPGSNEIRVYINGSRQYGNYIELTASGVPNYTVVGSTPHTSQTIPYVTGVVFDSSVALQIGDLVRIEIGTASLDSMGLFAIPVRTVEDEATFAAQVIAGTQPIYQSLTAFELTEQNKTKDNQYPLFDVYNVLDGSLISASPILTLVEDQASPVSSFTQTRLLISDGGVMIQQHLLDKDDNFLYGYRDLSLAIVGKYWYSPLRGTVQQWDGVAWTSQIKQTTTLGDVIRIPVVSSTDPTTLWTIQKSIWLNTNTNKLYIRNTAGTAWVEETNIVVSDADPTIRTIWRHGTSNEHYVPHYVDKNRVVVPTSNVNADWEVVDQWTHNPEHHNRSILTLSQILTHARSIVQHQVPTPGLIGGGAYTKIQSEYNYGVGGTIKEFNGAFDTLISSVNITNVTPVGIMEFASTEYAANLRFLRDIFNQQIIDLSINYQITPTTTFTDYIVNSLIAAYEDNDYVAQVYGDTSAFNETTGKGVRNWISTAPMFGLTPAYRPHMLVDGSFIQIYNHDGHRTNVEYTLAEEDAIARRIITKIDSRTSTPIGAMGVGDSPPTLTAFLTIYGGTELRTGVFWYKTGNPHTLYRFELYASSTVAPSFYIQGVEAPDGVTYYNTTTNNTYIKVGLSWVQVSAPASFDISAIWRVIDFQQLLGALFFEVENRLFDVCVGAVPVFDYSTLTPNFSETLVYNANYKKRFEEYVVDFSISQPYANTQYSQADAFTWNYLISTITTPPHGAGAPTPSSSWQLVYTKWYGTPYPHLEPWKLQGFVDKPLWWDGEYLQTNGSRRWIFTYAPVGMVMGIGMWENIRTGQIPAGRTYPDGMVSTGNSIADGQSLPTYNYFGVNISNSIITGGYAPDALLPPYYNTVDTNVRSLFTTISQVVAPYADYVFGDGSVIEWQWQVSAQYPYANPIIAYLMQPVRFLRASFGPKYVLVDGLEVDVLFNQVYSHNDTLFHGDLYDVNSVYEAKGLNQWYVNYNRFTGFDTSGDFRQLWVEWTPLLTYQSNSMLDTNTLDVGHNRFSIIKPDYNVILANNGAINDIWVDAFRVTVISAPPATTQYNNQSMWKVELTSLANTSRSIQFYDVKAYPFSASAVSDICHPFRYNIILIDTIANRLYVEGNQVDIFTPNTLVDISQSGADGTYTTTLSIYEPSVDRTRINILESIALVGTGVITLSAFVLPWSTGDMVILSSTKTLPAPLVSDTPYYVVNAAGNDFKLAETFNDAISNITIDILSGGVGIHTIAEIISSFHVMGMSSYSTEMWYHYAIDKSKVRSVSMPLTITGLQNVINTIDGYAEYQQDNGVIFNTTDANDFDYNTGRLVAWSLEVERLIDWAYGIRRAKLEVSDRFEYTVNVTDNTLTFVDAIPTWINGTAVQLTTTGSFPTPIIASATYYVASTLVPGVIKLYVSADVSNPLFLVDFTTMGSGRNYVATKGRTTSYPQFEINPNRNNIWLNTPVGVLSNIIEGPYTDIRVRQTIFDQYGRALGADKLLSYRQDERSRVAILPQIPNDVDLFFDNDPYNYIHLGGGHFFVEGYEHFIVFNPYTIGGSLIYDSFLGLSVSKIMIDGTKTVEHTLRPTLGGFYLKGQDFFRNIEGSASDLMNFYDTQLGSDDPITNQLSRALLGYRGTVDYLDALGVNAQSQFLFYRGMLHAKGSVAGILAYINSRKFTGANIDEFFAYKVAEFGDRRPQVYPEIILKEFDNIVDDVRFEFVGLDEDVNRTDIQYAINSRGFKLVSFSDDTRWNNFPNQQSEIEQPLFLDAEIHTLSRIYITDLTPPDIQDSMFDFWYEPTANVLRAWDGLGWNIVLEDIIHKTTTHIYWKHSTPCDDVRVIRRNITSLSDTISIVRTIEDGNIFESPNTFIVLGNHTTRLSGTTPIVVSGSGVNNGTFTVQAIVYDAQQDLTYISVYDALAVESTYGTLTYSYAQFDIYTPVSFTPASVGAHTYFNLNAEVVRLNISDFTNIIHIYTVRPSYDSINPAKLVSRKTNELIGQISMWHPAYGWNYYKAMFNIDLIKNQDPAAYSTAIQPSGVAKHFWNFAEVGTTWLDTSNIGYTPYYDTSIYPDINDRLGRWGQLTPYASVKVYQWVRSTVVPSEWDALAISQKSDTTLAPSSRASGTARTTLFKRSRTIVDGAIRLGPSTHVRMFSDTLVNDQTVFLTASSLLPEVLTNNTQYVVADATDAVPQTFNLKDTTTDDILLVDIPSYAVDVINKGTNATPINMMSVRGNVLSNSDQITINVTSGGILPMGSLSIPMTSLDYQEVVFKTPKLLTDTTGLKATRPATSGYQSVVLSTIKLGTSPTGLANNATVYSVTIVINGVSHVVSVTGSSAQTYTNLLTAINADLGSSGSAALNVVGNAITITSSTVGIASTVSIGSGTLFQSLSDYALLSASTAGINNITSTYTANISINSVVYSISITGSTAQTFDALIILINNVLGTAGYATMVNGNIRIYSVTNPTPSVSIADNNLFKSLNDFDFVNVISSSVMEFIVMDVINDSIGVQSFNLSPDAVNMLTIHNEGAGDITIQVVVKICKIVPSFDQDSWIKQIFSQQRIFGAWLSNDITTVVEPVVVWPISSSDFVWYDQDAVDIYKNGVFVANAILSISGSNYSINTVGTGLSIQLHDYIDVVRPIHQLTTAESEFDPDIQDDGVTLIQWKVDHEYSQSVVSISETGTSVLNYYFWVEGLTAKESGAAILSPLEIKNSLTTMPDPYLVVQKPLDVAPIIGQDTAPIMYREAIIRNIEGYVNSNNQYMIQFTRDLALRDQLKPSYPGLLKNKHQEWVMIRKLQTGNIPRNLWDKATESLSGQSLVDSSVIPSLDRVRYDDLYGTNTRYGLAAGQTFVDRTLARATLLAYLRDPTRNFAPIDINNFLTSADLTTPVGIQAAMDEIYNTFSSEHVNGIWFELLNDALTTNVKFKELMKTSWVAIHCTQPLNVNGMLGD